MGLRFYRAHVTVGESVVLPGSGVSYTCIEGTGQGLSEPVIEPLSQGRAWQGWLWILLFIAIAAVLAYGITKAATEPTIPDAYAIPPAEPDRRGTAQQPLVISKQAEDPEHTANERQMTAATEVLALFTFALWVVNIWLIIETKKGSTKQSQATQAAIGEAKRSADAMRDVAEATRNNALLMSGMLSKQMRAYIQVNIGNSTAQREEGVVFGSWPEIVNVGLTPAKKVSYRVMADILGLEAMRPGFVFPEPQQVYTNDATLNPRQSFTILAAVNRRINQDDVEAVSKGDHRRLFVWGTITYEDVFERVTRETRFSHNFVFFDRIEDPKTGKIAHKVNSFYSSAHNDAT
jgi:hypothetical protein